MITVIIVDDQPLARAGLKMILTPEDGFEIIGECGNGEEALALIKNRKPSIVVMDVRMPGMGGIEATKRIYAMPDGPPVLILTTFDDEAGLSGSLRAGASGFILKDAPASDIIRATKTVAEGNSWLDPAVTGRVLERYRTGVSPRTETSGLLSSLSEREVEVLKLIGRGATNPEIAETLFISETTVKSHIGSIFRKLNLRNRAAAVVFAFDHGLVQSS